jgi:hypothetical protein
LRRNIKIYLLWLTKKRNPVLGTGKGNETSTRRQIVRIQTKKGRKPPGMAPLVAPKKRIKNPLF